MAIPKEVEPQTDFSAGHLNVDMKRSGNPIVKSGARPMINWRLRNTGRPQQRPGKRAQFTVTSLGRVDEVRVLPGVVYRLCFNGDGTLQIRDIAGAVVATSGAAYNWRTATVWQIVWTQVRIGGNASDVVILFNGDPITIARFDGAAWTFPAFAFDTDSTGIALAPFYRVTALGVTLLASAITGAVTLVASGNVFLPAHVNTVFRYANRRIRIDGVADAMNSNATWLEDGFPVQQITITNVTGHIGAPEAGFLVGQLVQGDTSNTQGEVVAVGASTLYVQVLNASEGFSGVETIVGPASSATATAVAASATFPVTTWDEQLISNARGWPQSCSTDQGRLVLTDLPALPEAVIWSAIGAPYNMTVGAEASQPMIEPISGKPRVFHVIAGDGGEIVFTDKGIYYIPINENNPLKPGSVVFKDVSPEAASKVRPVRTAEAMLYINGGRNRVVAIVGSGATYSVKPYTLHDISRYHYDLFNAPVGLVISTGDGTFPERYVYVTNGDGSIVVGRFEITDEKNWVGWLLWNGAGRVNWTSSLQSNVMFSTAYTVAGVTANLIETIDDTTYLDASVLINAVPAGMAPPGGKGPMWWLPAATVDIMDGVNDLGGHQIDANGFIVPIGGEDLTSLTLTAGQSWQGTLEPFVPQAQGGQSVGQRMKRRRVTRCDVSVEISNGFVFAKLYSGPDGAMLPTQGTVIQSKRVPPYNQGDNEAIAPPLREKTYSFRTTGRRHDPRVAIIKDTPGPIRVLEVGLDVTV